MTGVSIADALFVADRDPVTGEPRLGFRFANGWSATLTIHAPAMAADATQASVTAVPSGAADNLQTEIIETAASADRAVRALVQIARRRKAEG